MIVFAWGGFPQYAARLVGAFVKSTDERVCVVGKPPAVAVEGMEKCTGCEIHWVQPNDTVHFVKIRKRAVIKTNDVGVTDMQVGYIEVHCFPFRRASGRDRADWAG